MEQIKTCNFYPTLKCNCSGPCRIKLCEMEETEKAVLEQELQQRRLDELVAFQFYLRDEGLISDTQWVYEEEAQNFLNSK